LWRPISTKVPSQDEKTKAGLSEIVQEEEEQIEELHDLRSGAA
jgi:hypothetical protein